MVDTWQRKLSLDGRGAVYEQIKRALTRPIRGGAWKSGDRIPGEEELAEHFQIARMTVNRALRELADEGLVVRKRRAGSFVAPPPAPAAMLEIVDMSKLIPARDQSYRYQILGSDIIDADAGLMARFELTRPSRLRQVTCLHFADEVPVELEERWINLTVLPEAQDEAFDAMPPGAWLLNKTPWTQAEHTISAKNADRDTAGHLQIDSGDACLILERRTFLEQRVVTLARLTHPGDRHALTERFSPG